MKTTKLTFFLLAGIVLSLGRVAQAQTNVSYTFNVNTAIPDGNAVGLSSVGTVANVIGYTTNVQVSLNISGGFNGDLYAYLVGPGGGMSILLNRSGLTAGNPFGYANTGFNITLNDGATNVHSYQLSGSFNGSGQLTGNWAPDGRNIDPQSAGSVFDAAATSSDLAVFNTLIPNGDWTLFIADLSGGGQSTLVSWGLTIVTVPEPQTWTLAFLGGLGFLFVLNRRRAR